MCWCPRLPARAAQRHTLAPAAMLWARYELIYSEQHAGQASTGQQPTAGATCRADSAACARAGIRPGCVVERERVGAVIRRLTHPVRGALAVLSKRGLL